jgi:3-hydroxyacyl-[acyl-carrier-protein] dehydratase
MLLSDFYTVEQSGRDVSGKRLTALISLNPFHEIFKGHFPGNPVLPGVCIIQILKEILMSHLGNSLVFNNLGSIKYFSVTNPEVNRLLNLDIELKETGGDETSFSARIYFESVVYCRIKGEFRFTASD